jgi:hypothetical protein
MSTNMPVDPKPAGLHEDRAELWYLATGIINSHETGDDLKQMALGIRQQLRLEARTNELTELFYEVKGQRDKAFLDIAHWVQLAKYQRDWFRNNHNDGINAGPCPTDAKIAASEKMIGRTVGYPAADDGGDGRND